MKRTKRTHRIHQRLAIVLAFAILSASIPPSLTESIYAAAQEKKNHAGQNIWYEISAAINASWGGHIAGEIIITNTSDTTAAGWQAEFPWKAQITSMWNGCYEQDGEIYTILPAGYNTELEPGASVSVGFLAEGEDEILSQLTTQNFFQENNALITTEEERQEEWYQKAKDELTPIPTPPAPEIPAGTPEAPEETQPADVPTPAATPTPVVIPTPIEAPTPTATPHLTLPPEPTPSAAPVIIPTPVVVPTPAITPMPVVTPTPVATPTPIALPTLEPIPTAAPWFPEPTPTPELITTAEPETSPVPASTGMPEDTPEPAGTSAPEVTAEPSPTETPTPTPEGTGMPEATPEPLPTETPEPAEDLYIYANTTLTEDTVCGNLVITAGTLNCNGYTVTVQKEMSVVGGGCTLQGGTLDVAGDAKLQNGILDIGAGSVKTGGNLREGETGSIRMLHSRGSLQVRGDMEIASTAESRYSYGTLQVGGDLIRGEEAGAGSFNLAAGFNLIMDGEKEQQVRDASPETSYYGTMNLRGSRGVIFEGKVRGKSMAGLSQIHNREKLELEVDSLLLNQDEETTCENVILSKGNYNLSENIWKINGALQIGGEKDARLYCSRGRLQVTEDVTIKNGTLYTEYGAAGIGGSLREEAKGSVWMTSSQAKLQVTGNLEIASNVESRYTGGTLLIGGDLIRGEEAGERSFSLSIGVNLVMNGQKEQQVRDASPETSYYGSMNLHGSEGVIFGQKVRGKSMAGLSQIHNREKLELEVDNLLLDQDEETTCENIILLKGTYRLSNYKWKINGSLQIGEETQASLYCDRGGLQVTEDADIKNGTLYTEYGAAGIGGSLREEAKGSVWMTSSQAKLQVTGNLEIASTVESRYTAGTLLIGGDLIRGEEAGERSFSLSIGVNLVMNGQKEQHVRDALSETSYFGNMDLHGSRGVTFEGKVKAKSLTGLSQIHNRKKLELEVDSLTLDQDEETTCENIILLKGTYRLSNYKWKINGSLQIGEETEAYLYCDRGSLQVTEDADIENGTLFTEYGIAKISGSLRVGEKGSVRMTYYQSELQVKGDMEIASTVASRYTAGTLLLGGDLTQEDASEDSFSPGNSYYLLLNGQREQEVSLAYPESMSRARVDITDAAGVYFDQDVYAYQLVGVQNITNEGEICLCSGDNTVTGDGALDGNLFCYGDITVEDYSLRIRGNLYLEQGITISEGSLTVDGNLRAKAGNLDNRNGKVDIKGDLTIKREAAIAMSGEDSSMAIHGNLITSSEKTTQSAMSGGTVTVMGDIRQTAGAGTNSLYWAGTKLILAGKEQTLDLHMEGWYLCDVDLSESEKVTFTNNSLYIRNLKGWDKIQNKMLVLHDASIRLEQDETYEGDLIIFGDLLHCNGHTFKVEGGLDVYSTVCVLGNGSLRVKEDYNLIGASILQMKCENDLLIVGGDFCTRSTLDHTTMLTNGRFLLSGNFNQEGHKDSFATTGDFEISFRGEGIQEVHFDNEKTTGFANVDPYYGYYTVAEISIPILINKTIASILFGIYDGLDELRNSEDELVSIFAVSLMAELGIESMETVISLTRLGPGAATAGTALMGLVFTVSGYCLGRYIGDMIHQGTTGPGSQYDKAREFARDVTVNVGKCLYMLLGTATGHVLAEQFLNQQFWIYVMEAMQENVWKPLSAATLKALSKPAGVLFDEAADCMAEGTLAHLKEKFAAGSRWLSPQKINRTIRKAYETLGEKLGNDDIDIILENLGMLTEEKLLGRLILRRVSGCMSKKTFDWLVGEVAEKSLSAAEVSSAVRKVAELDGGKIGEYEANDILTKLGEGMSADNIVEAYQGAVARIVKKTDRFIDYRNKAGTVFRISNKSGTHIDDMIKKRLEKLKPGDSKWIEAKVGKCIRDMGLDLTDFANKITTPKGETIGDIDCATENVFIEVKKSVRSVEKDQFEKYVDTSHEKFMNVKQKKVVLYIEDSMENLSGIDAEKISEIKGMGVRVVNGEEELKEVMELWEHPDLS